MSATVATPPKQRAEGRPPRHRRLSRAHRPVELAPASTHGRLGLSLGILGLVLMACTAYFAFVVTATPGRLGKQASGLIDELGLWSYIVDHVPVPKSQGTLGVTIVVASTLAFVAYGLVLVLTWGRRSRAGVAVVVGASVLCWGVSSLALPNHTSDVYDYALFARVATAHGENPYTTFPDEFPDDPIYPYSSHQYTGERDNKLPVWTAFSIGLSALAGDGPVANLMTYRLALVGLNMVNLALIAMILWRVRPEAALTGMAVYGLNPVISVYGPSKTDSLMVFLFLAAAALVVLGRPRLAMVGLALSSLVKLITLPLVAVYWLRRASQRRLVATLIDTALLLGVALVAYAAFGGLGLFRDQLDLIGEGGSSVPGVLQPVTTAIFVGLVAVVGWRTPKPEPVGDTTRKWGNQRLFWAWAVVALFFGLFLTKLGLPWYLMTAVAAVALAARGVLTAAVVALTWSSFLFGWWYSASTRTHPLPDLFGLPPQLLYAAPILAGGAALAAWTIWQRRQEPLARPADQRLTSS